MRRSIWLVIAVFLLQSVMPIAMWSHVNASEQMQELEPSISVDLESEENIKPEIDEKNEVEVTTEEHTLTSDKDSVEKEEVTESESPTIDSDGHDNPDIPIIEDDEVIQAKWQMDGELIYAHADGRAEYEFAFRHVPIEGQQPIDLEEATFYFYLPENATYRSSTFWGEYEPEHHRVVWQNIGGIPTSHANFDPATPRRVNVQIDYIDPPETATVGIRATYTPKGMTQRWTNEATITHAFKLDEKEWLDGIHIKGELEERPNLPPGYPLHAGQHFTYNVFYSLNALQPYGYGKLYVQLPGTIQFNKHVQLTGDFKDYYYDADHHRFIFNFKDEITQARGTMKINNLMFPNYITPNGTQSALNMQFIYNDSTVHGIEPDILVAMANSDWDVTHELPDNLYAPNDAITYKLSVRDRHNEPYGKLNHTNMQLIDQLPKEATFVEAYRLIDGKREEATYDATTHTVNFALGDDATLSEHDMFVTVRYAQPTERKVRHTVQLTYVPLEQSTRTITHSFRYAVEERREEQTTYRIPVHVQTKNERPTTNVELQLYEGDKQVASQTTDEEGNITFDVQSGHYELRIKNDDKTWQTVKPIQIELTQSLNEPIIIQLQRLSTNGGGGSNSSTQPETNAPITPENPVQPEPPREDNSETEDDNGKDDHSNGLTEQPTTPQPPVEQPEPITPDEPRPEEQDKGDAKDDTTSSPTNRPDNSTTVERNPNGEVDAKEETNLQNNTTSDAREKRPTLPQTGEETIRLMIGFGIVLIGAGIALIRTRRTNTNE